MTAITDSLRHEDFCRPRPGQEAPRLEFYPAARYGADGLPGGGSVHCARCLECGVTSYDGVQKA